MASEIFLHRQSPPKAQVVRGMPPQRTQQVLVDSSHDQGPARLNE